MSRRLVLGLIFLSVSQFWKLPLVDANPNQIAQSNTRELEQEVQRTLLDLSRSLILLQEESGEWEGILESDPSYDAMMLILGQQLGTLTEALKAEIFERIFRWEGYLAGLWAAYPGGAPSLDVTGVVLYGLKAAGLDADDSSVSEAWSWFESQGGWQRLHPLNQFFLAVGGSLPADVVPYISPKFLALPKWFPINIHNIGIMRIAIVPLSVWSYYKKSDSPNSFSKIFAPNRNCSEDEILVKLAHEEIRLHRFLDFISETQNSSSLHHSITASWRKFIDEFMELIDHNTQFSRELPVQVGICWLLKHQRADGTWAGVIHPTYLSIMALLEADRKGAGDFSSEIAHAWGGLIGWRRFVPGLGMIQQLSEGPVMETARVLNAFYSVPLNLRLRSDLEEENAINWLAKNQIRKKGDWSYNLSFVLPGGWAYQYYNDFYPDTDDTAIVLESLIMSNYRHRSDIKEAISLGIDWALAMQNRDGGFPVWTHETSPIIRRLFSDDKTIEVMSDPSQVDVTTRVLRALIQLKKEPHLYDAVKLEIAIQKA
jgi:squalene-hopene/tetraprenyl-beta-curcumene cyclase